VLAGQAVQAQEIVASERAVQAVAQHIEAGDGEPDRPGGSGRRQPVAQALPSGTVWPVLSTPTAATPAG